MVARQPLWRRHFYSVLALLYVVQAGAVFLLAKTTTVAVTGTFLATDVLASAGSGETVLAPATQHLYDANIVGVIIGMLLVAAITYGVLAYMLRRSKKDDDAKLAVERRVRWIGLGVAGATSFYLLCLVLGIRDITALAPLIALDLLGAVVGYMLESRQRLSKRVLYGLGVATALLPWLVLAVVVLLTAQYGTLTATTSWIFAVSAVLSLLLSAGMYNLCMSKRPLKLEAAVFMSVVVLVFHASLTWQVFFGYLRA